MNLDLIRDLVTRLAAELGSPTPVPEAPAADLEAPFGRSADGVPLMAPAYDKCRALWEAAQRSFLFSIWVYVGGGIQEGAAQMHSGRTPDLRAIEDAIVALGRSPWGRGWLADDRNAALIDRAYQRLFLGYHVERVNQNDESQGYKRMVPLADPGRVIE